MKIVVFGGGSGSGKSFIRKRLWSLDKNKYKLVTSFTTRSPRNGEVDGEDYHFIDSVDTSKCIIESATVLDHIYGIYESELCDNKINLIISDVQGAISIRDYCLYNKYDFELILFDLPYHIRKHNILKRNSDINRLSDNIMVNYEMNQLGYDGLYPSFIIRNLIDPDRLSKTLDSFLSY